MTSKITIEAHCPASREVRFVIADAKTGVEIEEAVLQDGEKRELYLYDDRYMGAMEMEKDDSDSIAAILTEATAPAPARSEQVRYRKKPIVIDAVQLKRRMLWPDWFHDAVTRNDIITHGMGKHYTGEEVMVEIKTLEGVMTAEEGDWILKGVQGEIYPCKAGIFAATYDVVRTGDKS